MKPCHICEKIVRTEKSIGCMSCKKGFCFYCVGRHFPEKAGCLLGKREGQSFPTLKVSECFACLRECQCHKCQSVESVVFLPSAAPAPAPPPASLLAEEEPVAETGLFRGRRVGDLPLHLQRLYLKKKVLYSKHEISCLSNDKNIPEQQNAEQQDEKLLRIAEEKDRKEEESALQNNELEEAKGHAVEKKNQMDEEEEQPDDYESEFPSRRAEHLHNQIDNSAINDADIEDQAEVQGSDPNNENEAARDDSMGEENAENKEENDGEQVEGLEEQNNCSSAEEAGQ